MNGKILSGPAAVLLILLFFLPWISVSCDDVVVGEFTGYDLAIGTPDVEENAPFMAAENAGEPLLFIVPLAGVATLLLLGITLLKSNFEENASWGRIIASLLGILVLVLEWLQFQNRSDGTFEALIEPALWGTIVCLAANVAGALIDLVLHHRRPYGRSLSMASTRKKRPSRSAGSARREDFMANAGQGGETILDEGAAGYQSYGAATILDDDFVRGAQYGGATMLDEDFAGESSYDGATILDEDLVAEQGSYDGATILSESLAASRQGYDGATILDDDLVQGGEDEAYTVLDEDVAKMETAPSVPKPRQEPLHRKEEMPADDLTPTVVAGGTEILHVPPEQIAWLVITSGDREGERFRVLREMNIGRDRSNEIVLTDTALSAKHARVRSEKGKFYVIDRNSTNGVFVFDVNDQKWVKKDACEIENGSQFRLGRTVFRLVISDDI